MILNCIKVHRLLVYFIFILYGLLELIPIISQLKENVMKLLKYVNKYKYAALHK